MDTKKFLPYVIGLVVALFVSIGIGFGLVSFGNDGENYSGAEPATTEKIPTPAPTQTNNKPAEPVQENVSPVAKQTGALNGLDLSLGALSIGDNESKVYQVLGQPNTTRTENGEQRLKYGTVEVVLKNGKISALVSQSAEFETPRSIREGSSAQEVFNAYGKDYVESSFENDTLYEYKINSVDGTPCWLRFSVRNSDGKVDYISARFAQ